MSMLFYHALKFDSWKFVERLLIAAGLGGEQLRMPSERPLGFAAASHQTKSKALTIMKISFPPGVDRHNFGDSGIITF